MCLLTVEAWFIRLGNVVVIQRECIVAIVNVVPAISQVKRRCGIDLPFCRQFYRRLINVIGVFAIKVRIFYEPITAVMVQRSPDCKIVAHRDTVSQLNAIAVFRGYTCAYKIIVSGISVIRLYQYRAGQCAGTKYRGLWTSEHLDLLGVKQNTRSAQPREVEVIYH